MSLKSHLQSFLEYLEIEKNRSPKTLRNYHFYLQRFLAWYGPEKKASSLSSDDVRQFRLWLNRQVDRHGEPLKKNTQNYHLIALRAFLKYLAKQDVKTLAAEKIELMQMPDREIHFLDEDDLYRLLDAPVQALKQQSEKQQARKGKKTNTTLAIFRDKAMLELLFSTGLRVSELTSLKIEQINLKRDEFSVLGKGRKRRVVFLSEDAKHWIKRYLDARADVNPYLFISHSTIKKGESLEPEPLTTRSVQRIVKKYAKQAGITTPVSPHTMRHSYATDLLKNGADIRSVQAMLGHSDISTTQIYTHVTDKTLRDVHQRFHNKRRKNDE